MNEAPQPEEEILQETLSDNILQGKTHLRTQSKKNTSIVLKSIYQQMPV